MVHNPIGFVTEFSHEWAVRGHKGTLFPDHWPPTSLQRSCVPVQMAITAAAYRATSTVKAVSIFLKYVLYIILWLIYKETCYKSIHQTVVASGRGITYGQELWSQLPGSSRDTSHRHKYLSWNLSLPVSVVPRLRRVLGSLRRRLRLSLQRRAGSPPTKALHHILSFSPPRIHLIFHLPSILSTPASLVAFLLDTLCPSLSSDPWSYVLVHASPTGFVSYMHLLLDGKKCSFCDVFLMSPFSGYRWTLKFGE